MPIPKIGPGHIVTWEHPTIAILVARRQTISNYPFIILSKSLEVFTKESLPEKWALTQNNLGNAYRIRRLEEPAKNLKQAIHHYRQALEVFTEQTFPERWVGIQINLLIINRELPGGLQIAYSLLSHPHNPGCVDRHTRQSNRKNGQNSNISWGEVYYARGYGERAENIEQAIYHCQQALEVYTGETQPVNWARTVIILVEPIPTAGAARRLRTLSKRFVLASRH